MSGAKQPGPRYARRRGVEVPAVLFWILGGTALAGVVATAYLAGRLTARPSAGQEAPTTMPAGGSSAASPTAAREAPGGGPLQPSAAQLPSPAPTPSAGAAPSSTPPAPTTDPALALRREVAQYFADLDAMKAGQSLSGDPQALAQQILTRAMGGDTSGLDELVETQRSVTQRVRAISPPSPCAEHHRRTLALLEKTLTLTRDLRDALGGGNPEGLLGLEAVAHEAEAESRELKELEQNLRRAYGLPGSSSP